jgi:AraC family transcriptional regulator, chitin signaling transcriptional activator
MKSIVSLLLLFLLLATAAIAQFKTINMEKGLSNNTAISLLQDSRGFLWIGTMDGLNRYDGKEIKVFKHIDTDTTSLFYNAINALHEDTEGNIWIEFYGESSKVQKYIFAKDRFESYPLNSKYYRPSFLSTAWGRAGQYLGYLFHCYSSPQDDTNAYPTLCSPKK